MTPYGEFIKLQLPQLLEELAGSSSGSVPGTDKIHLLQSLVEIRTAEMVNRQLSDTASSIDRSAHLIKESLDHATLIVKESLENSSGSLIAAVKVNTDTGSKNAQDIREQIGGLTASLAEASADLRTANVQSTRLASRLNWLTAVVAIAAVLTAGATIYYAAETKRLVDLTTQQLRDAAQRSVTNAPKPPSKDP